MSQCSRRGLANAHFAVIGALSCLTGVATGGVQLLELYGGSSGTLTSNPPSTAMGGINNSQGQPIQASWMHRAARIDGTERVGWPAGPDVAANPSDPGDMPDGRLLGLRLVTGQYEPLAIDMNLPCAGPSWVIGRTRTSQVSDGGKILGKGWIELSQSQVKFLDRTGDADDVVFIFVGGDRYLEFRRVMVGPEGNQTPSEVFRGVNGTAGAVTRVGVVVGASSFRSMNSSSGEPTVPMERFTYHDPTGSTVEYFGFDGTTLSTPGGTADARGQIWRITDASGYMSYVGDPTTPETAITQGYDNLGRIRLAYDSAGRSYVYKHDSLPSTGGVPRLVSVVAKFNNVEVQRVEYSYYETASERGRAGDLKEVKVTTPSTVPNVQALVTRTHYRYWTTTSASTIDDFARGPNGSVRLVLYPEGVRNATNGGSDPSGSVLDSVLETYGATRFGYSGSIVNRVVGGGLSGVVHVIGRAQPTTPPSTTNGYDQQWAWRSKVTTQLRGTTTALRTMTCFFDEVGQPLTQVIGVKLSDGSMNNLVSAVERSASGLVTRVGSPESVSNYAETTGTFNQLATGRVTVIDRTPDQNDPVELTGFARQIGRSGGWSSAPVFQSATTYRSMTPTDFPRKNLGSYIVRRPLIATSKSYRVGGGSPDTTTFTYDLQTSVPDTSSLALTINWMKSTQPAVLWAEHGSGSGRFSAVAMMPNGLPTFIRGLGDANGTMTAIKYALPGGSDPGSGLITQYTTDWSTGITDYGTPPAGFPGAQSMHPAPHTSYFQYDKVGREILAAGPDGLTTETVFGTRPDGRMMWASGTRRSGSSAFMSPGSLGVVNLAGRTELSAQISTDTQPGWNQVAYLASAPHTWLDWSSTDQLHVVAGANKLRSPVLAFYESLATGGPASVGLRPTRVYQYHSIPAFGSLGTMSDATTVGNYDMSRLTYDTLGQVHRRINPAGAFTEISRDSIGRPVTVRRGVDTDGTGNSTAYQGIVAEMLYSSASGRLSKLTMYPSSLADISDKRETDYFYDGWGRLSAIAAPDAPHSVFGYDNLDRVVTTAKSRLSRTDFLAASPQSMTPDSISNHTFWRDDTWFDAAGQIYKESNARSYGSPSIGLKALVTDRWFDPQGRISREHGSSTRKWEYADRVGNGQDIEMVLGMAVFPDDYADAYLLGQHDNVLYQRNTIYDQNRVFPIGYVQSSRLPRQGPDQWPAAGSLLFNPGQNPSTVSLASNVARVTAQGIGRDDRNRPTKFIDFGNGWTEHLDSNSPYRTNSVSFPADLAAYVPSADPLPKSVKASFTWYDALGRSIEQRDQRKGFTRRDYDEMGRPTREYGGQTGGGEIGSSSFPNLPSGNPCNPVEEKNYEYRRGVPEIICNGISCDPNNHPTADPEYPPRQDPTSICAYMYECDPKRFWSPDVAYRVSIPGPENLVSQLIPAPDSYLYARNWLGEVVAVTDPAGVKRTITRDALGRVSSESFTYPTTAPAGMDTSISSMSYTYSACNRCIEVTTAYAGGATQTSTIGRDSWQNEWAVEQPAKVMQGGAWVAPIPGTTGGTRASRTKWIFEEGTGGSGKWRGPRIDEHRFPFGPDDGMSADERYLIGENFGPRALGTGDDFDAIVGRISSKEGPTLSNCVGSGTCFEEIIEKTGYFGIWPVRGHGGAAEMQQPRGGEQVTRYWGPNAPGGGINWPPPGGIKPVGLSPMGEPETTRPLEYCAGMSTNCCMNNSCDSPREYTTDRDQGPRPQDICCGIMHIDLEQPADISIKEIICAGIQDTYLGTNLPDNNLVPVGKRRENWAYDNGNWTTHNKKTEINSQWVIGQRGDFERTMEYSKSDQPKTETISKYGDPYTRTFKVFHDKRGNVVDDGRQVFEYDALNRLTGVWESAKGGGQIDPVTELPYNSLEACTKGDPVAAYTYDGYGHRLTARYNSNSNGVIDDDPVDVYAYDRLWRIRTVTRATPSDSTSSATWTYYVREKWYYHDTESGQEMMTGPASTDAPVLRLIDTNGDGDFTDTTDVEQHFINDHQGSTVLVTGKATLNGTTGELISRGPVIAHVKYDQYGVPKFVHPADANSDGVVDAADLTFWKQAWNEYFHGTGGGEDSPPKEIWKGVADANENGTVDNAADPNNQNLPSATNTDWVAFQAQYAAATVGNPPTIAEQLGNLPLYAGYWWDDAIGLYHVRHRVYRPEWGRWLQRDPLGYAPGWNLYQYVNGMPWSAVDPMGLWSLMRWLYTSDGNATDEVYEAALNAAGSTIPTPVVRIADAIDTKAGRRVLGALQTVAGGFTAAGGAALGWTGIGVGVAGVGVDMMQAGLRQTYMGEWTPTVLSSAIDWGAAAAGVSADDRPLVVGTLTAVTQVWSISKAGQALGSSPHDYHHTVPSRWPNASSTIAARIAELRNAIPTGSRGRITMAAALVEDSSGIRSVLIGTSEPNGYLRPGVILSKGEQIVRGTGHAEADIISHANSHGLRIIEIGATRPVCLECQQIIGSTGAKISTPVKCP